MSPNKILKKLARKRKKRVYKPKPNRPKKEVNKSRNQPAPLLLPLDERYLDILDAAHHKTPLPTDTKEVKELRAVGYLDDDILSPQGRRFRRALKKEK